MLGVGKRAVVDGTNAGAAVRLRRLIYTRELRTCVAGFARAGGNQAAFHHERAHADW
ncbi:MAG: hypothetical protein U0452_12275 [Anaerolineae bacterium]